MPIRRDASRSRRAAPLFGIAALAPVVLAGAVAAAPAPVRPPEAAPAPAPVPAVTVSGPTARLAGDLKIAPAALAAYQKTEHTMASTDPDCGVSWNLLAGVDRIEPTLPDASRSDTPLAVHPTGKGPGKLLPAAWARFASDGDGDGKSDPGDVFDATLATARYLCSSGLNLRKEGQALLTLVYLNNSVAYAETVLGWAETYATGVAPRTLPPIYGSVPPLYVPNPSASEPALPSYTPPVQSTPGNGGQTAPDWGAPATPGNPAEPEAPEADLLPPNVLEDLGGPGGDSAGPDTGPDLADLGVPDTGPQVSPRISVQSGGTVRSGR